MSFQNYSPTGADIDNLGIYLLVSLFFVMAAMVECAIVLAIKRICDRQFCHQQQEMKFFNQLEVIPRENGDVNRNGNNNLDTTPNGISRLIASHHISEGSTLSSIRTPAEFKISNIRTQANLKVDEQLTWMHLIPSPITIDMMALILFPTFYVAFSVLYFKLIL